MLGRGETPLPPGKAVPSAAPCVGVTPGLSFSQRDRRRSRGPRASLRRRAPGPAGARAAGEGAWVRPRPPRPLLAGPWKRWRHRP